MKIDKSNLPYRKGVIGLVVDEKGKVLLAQMLEYGDHQWRFPGGGIDEGESDNIALIRELKEELQTNKFKIVKKSKYVNEYDWPDEVIKRQHKKSGKYWRGQQQSQFLVKFTGKKSDINPDPKEIKNIKWVSVEELEEHLVFPRQWELAELIIKELLGN
ncbi:NUDIX domain-containing protein [Patescibacteria group bacterium]|nr:NUDIX domain-containing protein [Patescibacteria group bacterium]